MNILFCSPAEAKRFTHYLHSRYGIPLKKMGGWRWIIHQKNIHVISSEAASLSTQKTNLFSLGMLAFTDFTTFAPTSSFIILVGDHITQNRVELPPSQLDSFFARKKIDREKVDMKGVLSDGWVAVCLHGKVIGSAQVNRNHLIPNLPGQGNEASEE